ncbi:MAG: D-glycero-beta-D-manno-heptose 1-phosphate adenylyltransferase [Bacteroidota bacterium]|jgi:rfaE bifunctional protein nucleotidyltransferase chain/domain
MNHTENIKNKIQDWSTLEESVSKWRKDGCKIVFTNGCFDLLHLGHADYLARAADMGDKLVIGLNSDYSISRLKGANRPITNQDSRAFLLASMSFVSAVVIFQEDTPALLIERICPDVLVKGGDYAINEIVGHEFVLSNGGQVVSIPLVNGYSTTDIESRILKGHNK